MRKLLTALVLSLVVVGLVVAPVIGESKSVGAFKAEIYNCLLPTHPVVGLAIFNTNAAGDPGGLNVEVLVTDLPEGTYEIRVGGTATPSQSVGQLKVNKHGHGAAHVRAPHIDCSEGEGILFQVNIWIDGTVIIAKTAQTAGPTKLYPGPTK